MSAQEQDDFIIEYVVVGNSVKATAFDPRTLLDATVIGSRNTPKKHLEMLAVRKLIYRLRKEANSSTNGDA
jgi:hypothetical protein